MGNAQGGSSSSSSSSAASAKGADPDNSKWPTVKIMYERQSFVK